MEKAELEMIAKLKNLAADVFRAQRPKLQLEVDDIEHVISGARAEDTAKGMLLVIKALEIQAGI